MFFSSFSFSCSHIIHILFTILCLLVKFIITFILKLTLLKFIDKKSYLLYNSNVHCVHIINNCVNVTNKSKRAKYQNIKIKDIKTY